MIQPFQLVQWVLDPGSNENSRKLVETAETFNKYFYFTLLHLLSHESERAISYSIPITKLDDKYYKMLESTNTLKSAKDETASNSLYCKWTETGRAFERRNILAVFVFFSRDVLWSQQRWAFGLHQRLTQASFGSSHSLLLSHPTNGIIFWRHDSADVTRIWAACLIPSLAWFALTEKFIAPCRLILFYSSNYKCEKSI